MPDPVDGMLPPEGWVLGVTVCEVPDPLVSLLVQTTVLFTPITTVIVSGEKPGAAFGPLPAPLRMETTTLEGEEEALARGNAAVSPETRRRRKMLAAADLRRIIDANWEPLLINLSGASPKG